MALLLATHTHTHTRVRKKHMHKTSDEANALHIFIMSEAYILIYRVVVAFHEKAKKRRAANGRRGTRDTTSKSTTIFNCTALIVCYRARDFSTPNKSSSDDLFELKIAWPSCWRLRSVGVLWFAFEEGPHVRAPVLLSSSTADTNGHKHWYRLPSLPFRFGKLSSKDTNTHSHWPLEKSSSGTKQRTKH